MTPTTAAGDQRVLVLMPTTKDGERSRNALAAAGIACAVCEDMAGLCREVAAGAGAALLTEEAVAGDRAGRLAEALRAQPTWSDFPLIVLSREGAAGRQASFRESMNVTLVERPVRMRSLVSVVRAALRSRCHQYAVRDHLAERRRAEEALKEADRRKDEFLAMLAHELRNPLAPIRTAVQIMRRRGLDDPALRSAREVVERQVQHMTRLVDDLLDVSRITRGKAQLQQEPVDLATVVTRAIETSRPLIEARRHELTVVLPPGTLRLHADPTRLAQVVANLLNNAAKYTEEGGRIRLTAERAGCEAVLRVADTGIGIPAEMLPRVFDLFTQADRTLDRSQGGLGIGLTLARSLVGLHGGSVEAFSNGPGQGSEFVVRLPLLPEARQQGNEEEGEKPCHPGSASRRILIVDDNVDAAEMLAAFLRMDGHEVRAVHDGPSALGAAQAHRPEIIFLDIGLPGMNGYEVARALRTQPGLGKVQLVALTGYGQDEDRRRSKEAGFDHHLVKPLNADVLEALLARSEPAA